MKISRCLFLVALIFGLSGLAKADPIDFHMTVLDPGSTTALNIDAPGTFTVAFSACPDGYTNYDGCFVGLNNTNAPTIGTDITFYSLNLIFPDIAPLNTQSCNVTPETGTIFDNSNCTSSNGSLVLNFFGGSGIKPGETFYIVENGVPAADFPPGMGTVATPEPDSILLLSTGVVLMGVFFISRRRGEGLALRF